MTEGEGLRPPTQPPAGWYPDPYDASAQRYWNGSAWDMSTPSREPVRHSDPYPDIGDWLDRGFRIAYRRWRAVLVVSTLTTPLLTVAILIAIDRLAEGVVISEDGVDGWTNDRLGVAIPLLLAALIISAIGGLALSWLMLRTVDGDEPNELTFAAEFRAAGRALRAGATCLPRAIAWTFAALIGVVAALIVLSVITVATSGIGVVLFVAAIPVVVWLVVKWVFVPIAIVDRPGNPYTRSAQVVSGRWWSTLGRLILLGIIMWLVSIVIQSVAGVISGQGANPFGGGGATFRLRDDGSFDTIVLDDELSFTFWPIVVGVITSILGTVLASSVSAAAMSWLYRTRHQDRTGAR